MTRVPPTIDMLPDGRFRAPPPTGMPFTTKLIIGGVLIAAVGTAIAVAALALWIVSLVLPVIIIAAFVAWAAMRYRRWQLVRGQRHAGRPGPLQPGRFGQ